MIDYALFLPSDHIHYLKTTRKDLSVFVWTGNPRVNNQFTILQHSILLGMSIETSTHLSYTSALNSYLTFCKLHDFDINPTPETLSLFVTYQSTFINPRSVDSYLSGITNQMEAFFPHVRQNRNSTLVSRTIKGAKRRYGTPLHRKTPLSLEDLEIIYNDLCCEYSDIFPFFLFYYL